MRVNDDERFALSVGGEAFKHLRCVERQDKRLAFDAYLLCAEFKRAVVVQRHEASRRTRRSAWTVVLVALGVPL